MPVNTAQVEDIFVPREEHIKSLLSSILNLNLGHEENENVIVNTINRFLGHAKQRKEGLEYLMLILDNCSSDTIAKNAVLWINHCTVKYSDDILREKKLKAVGKLIENAYDEADFNKKFVSEYISKVVDTCLETSNINPYECRSALSTLVTCMKFYPSWFTSHRSKVEKFLLVFLDKDDDGLVRFAAEGFHYLQQVGGAGSDGIYHKANFTKSFNKLCATVNNLFNRLLEGDTEIFHTTSSNEDVFEFQDEVMTQNVSFVIARRIKNCLNFLEYMIRTKFPVAKEISPKKLIEIITRGTSLHRCISKEEKALESCQSSLILTGVQVKLLRILRLFIIWLGTNALPFSYPISKVLVDNLERCQSCSCFKYESLYQESIYKAIDEWLKILKSSLHANFQEQLTKCILKDITPVKVQITLNISEGFSKGESAKSKRKSIENKIISSGQGQRARKITLLKQTNEINNCKFALGTLKCFLQSTRLDIKNGHLKEIYKSVFDTLMTIQISKPVHPYTDASCQARLYEVLVAFYHQDQLSLLPPLQTTLNLLTRGANNNNRFISAICARGLQTLEVLCQPACPSLYAGSKPRIEQDAAHGNGYTNGLEIEFSPEQSLHSASPESNAFNDEESTYINIESEENKKVHEVIDAENDNNTNMEIEQQAEIHGANSVRSDTSSLILNIDGDEDVPPKEAISTTVVTRDEVLEIDSEEPPSKKLKPADSEEEDDVFEENKEPKTSQAEQSNVADEDSKTNHSETEATQSVDENTDNIAYGTSDVTTNVSNAGNPDEPESDDSFVDKVLDSFVDEVKEY